MENKVTLEQIQSKIKGEMYLVLPDGKTTLCVLTMENGYTIKGLSACVDAANFDMNIGRKIAHEDAIRQIWPLEGYLLAQRLHEEVALKAEIDGLFDHHDNGIVTIKKKPHWTQTPEGKVKMANRKKTFTLNAIQAQAIKKLGTRKGARK